MNNLFIIFVFLIPGASSTPEDKSIPSGFAYSLILLIFDIFMPPDKNQGFLIFNSDKTDQLNFFALPPGNSFSTRFLMVKNMFV